MPVGDVDADLSILHISRKSLTMVRECSISHAYRQNFSMAAL